MLEYSIRPWGNWQMLGENEGYWVKRISVNPGKRLSLQYHLHRSEKWVIVTGQGLVTLCQDKNCYQENIRTVTIGDVVYIPQEVIHRIDNTGLIPLVFIEVALGKPEEDDIIRLKDDFGRI